MTSYATMRQKGAGLRSAVGNVGDSNSREHEFDLSSVPYIQGD